jgi:hypothetical protein
VENFRQSYGSTWCDACEYRKRKEAFNIRRDAENVTEVLLISTLDPAAAELRRRRYMDSQSVGVNKAGSSTAPFDQSPDDFLGEN